MKKTPTKTRVAERQPELPKYDLRLYVCGSTLKSQLAVENTKLVCDQYLQGRYALKVIDICHQANLARAEQIVAVPTLIKRLPVPLQRFVGDMSNISLLLLALGLRMQER